MFNYEHATKCPIVSSAHFCLEKRKKKKENRKQKTEEKYCHHPLTFAFKSFEKSRGQTDSICTGCSKVFSGKGKGIR
jgi:hypothetical protein